MILSDRPAKRQGVRCLPLQGERADSVNLREFPPKMCNRLSWPFHWQSIDRGLVPTGRLALFSVSFRGNNVLDSAAFAVNSEAHGHRKPN